MNHRLLLAWVVVVIVPALPLLLTWRQVLRRRDPFAVSSLITVKLPLAIITASDLLFFLALFAPVVLGHDYSNRRFGIIWTNLGLTLAVLGLSLRGRNPFRVLLATTAAAAALVWLYVLFVSAAV